MAQKIIYFTAGQFPTEGELSDIAKLTTGATAPYELLVVNGNVDVEYAGSGILDCDFVAGTIPEAYGEIDEMDPDAIPDEPLLSTQHILSSGDEITLDDSNGTIAVTIVDYDIATADLTLPTTKAIVVNEDDITLDGSNGTVALTVAGSEITGAELTLPDTKVILEDEDEITLDSSNGTVALTIAAGAISGAELNLPATKAIVANTQAIAVTVTGIYTDTATFTVVANAITAIALS